MDLQPRLVGPDLELRPIRSDDFEALFAAAADPRIWEQHSENNRFERPVFQKFFDGALACGGGLVVVDRASGRVIGSSRYYDWNPGDRSIVVGYTFLTRSHWGGLANRELKELMLTHAFKYVETVWFHVSPQNLRSQSALLKIGAVFERQENVLVGGVPSSRMIFRVSRTKRE